jgi:hypothetical protein
MKPIIFSTPMVQAILDGKKTQTRRVIKINGYPITSPEESLELTKEGLIYHSFCSMSGYYKLLCQPGDILWVRETWCTHEDMADVFENQLRPGYYYKANEIGKEWVNDREIVKWRPSIFMPREAARIFLRVKTVRVERLQDITAHDAIREGMESEIPFDTVDKFKELWNNLNAKRGYGWETNPWVWVYEFEKINKE